MTKLSKKVLSILCVIALLVSGIVMAFAEEADDAPVWDETTQEVVGGGNTQQADAEEAARIAAEQAAAQKAAEEEAARKAAEEEAARKAAEEEAARKAAEEEAARKAAEEEAARKAAEEEAARRAAEEEAARKAAEEEVAKKAAGQDIVDENGYYEFDDSWGYVDPDIISEKTPEITDEFKGLRSASMSVNEILSDTISFGDELVITLKSGSIQTLTLKLYTTGDVNVKVDDKAVAFTPADSDDNAYAMSTFVLENTAGRSHKISLSAGNTVSIKLAAVAEQTEVLDVTPGTEEVAPTVNKIEESIPSEDINDTNTEVVENTENTETTDTTETTENTEKNETTENTEAIETNETGDNTENNNNEVTVEPIQPVQPAEPTIQVSMKSYSALKVGGNISDTLVGGQKAKLQVKCGKHNNVKLVLNSNPDDITIKIDGTDTEFTQEADGTYTIELNDVAFRKFSIVLAAKQDLAFSLSAEEAGEAIETSATEGDENEDDEEGTEEDYNKEETEPTEEATDEENTEANSDENTEEVGGETKETEKTEEETAEDKETSEEEIEGEEAETVEQNTEEENEKMTGLGCIKATVTAEEGADLYAEASKESDVVGHLDIGTEAWITLNEDQTFGQIYREDEEAPVKFISIEDVTIVVEDAEEVIPVEETWYARSDMSVVMIDETGNVEQGHKAYAVSNIDGQSTVAEGTKVTLKIKVDNLTEEETCEFQWFYSKDGGETWKQIENEIADAFNYTFNFEMWKRSWKAVVTIR